jgi:ABC-type glycerol-3-phosphate transport system substrate-binding protein
MQIRSLVPRAAVFAAMLSAMLGACAPAPTSAPAPAQPAATEAPGAPEATEAPAMPAMPAGIALTAADVDKIVLSKDSPTEITFLHRYSGAQEAHIKQIADEFNATNEYGITVNLEKVDGSYDDLYNKINAALQGGAPPDLAQAYQNQASFYRNEGAVVDLSPYIQSSTYGLVEDELKDYYQAFLESDKNPQYAGEVLGWPTSRSMAVLYTNLDWLEQLGVQEPPKTLKEFEDLACKASDPANNKYGYIWNGDASNFAAFVFANGGNILKPDASGYDFNSPAGVEALSMLQRMFKNGCAVQLPPSESFGDQARFGAGSLLFNTASSTGLPFYADAIAKAEKPFRWTISMLPQADPAKPKTDLYGASWSVFKSSPEKQLASWLFMKYFTQPGNIAKWANASNYIATRMSAAPMAIENVKNSDRFKAFPEAAEGYTRLYDMLQYGAVESPVAGYDPVRKLISDLVVNVAINGEGDPQAALDEAVAQADEILKENAPQ